MAFVVFAQIPTKSIKKAIDFYGDNNEEPFNGSKLADFLAQEMNVLSQKYSIDSWEYCILNEIKIIGIQKYRDDKLNFLFQDEDK